MSDKKNRLGWVCPKCDRGVSPDVKRCPCEDTPEDAKDKTMLVEIRDEL